MAAFSGVDGRVVQGVVFIRIAADYSTVAGEWECWPDYFGLAAARDHVVVLALCQWGGILKRDLFRRL